MDYSVALLELGQFLLIALGIAFIISILLIICQWNIFKKAGEKGWKALIPVYNTYIYLKICGISGWFLLIHLLPFIGIEELQDFTTAISFIFSIYSSYRLSKVFGHGIGYTIGLVLLPFVFYPILAFGSSEYSLETEE